MVFTSNDKLHASLAPLFMTDDQTFVPGVELKSDLARLDAHYDSLPDEVKAQGMIRFADDPPRDGDFLITRLWDKHLPRWRSQVDSHEPLSPELQQALVDLMKKFETESSPLPGDTPVTVKEASHVAMRQRVYMQKGKWKRFPPEVKPNS